ncbi:VOC family protein [Roseococcus sp. YIM B11640]|uniref:VOC family protein n=1 Tax=Roseococcus sp. YIM B11640 TaxID=3133973 RepID=UPI003C7A29D4
MASRIEQQITFLYAEAPEASWRFYEEVLELPLVRDQGDVRIYAAGGGFLGICRARQPGQAVLRAQGSAMVTLVTEDVEGWRAALAAKGVDVPESCARWERYGITHFFFRDPAGYTLEIQRFDAPIGKSASAG